MAIASWMQLALSMLTYVIVARRCGPADIGAFGVAMLLAGAVEAVLGPPLTQSLEQRASLEQRHVDATFWVSLGLSLLLTVGLVMTAPMLADYMHAPASVALLYWIALGLPVSLAAGIPWALLSRDLRFAELSRIGSLSSISSSVVGVVLVTGGAGIWSLVAADLTARLVKLIGVITVSKFRPGWPRKLGSIRDLMAFNLTTLVTFGLNYLDQAVPRFFTSILLGATSLGYLSVAQRIFDLLSQVVLTPMNNVMLTTVARLQADRSSLRQLVRTIYLVSSSLAYPAFLAVAVLTPDLIGILGPRWAPAVTTVQIYLLIGLRTSTGTFNFAILRGTGRTGGPIIIMAVGLVLNLLLVPIGARFGTDGIAAAVLLRTLGTWPIGCRLVEQATGLAVRDQLKISLPAVVATLVMCVLLLATLNFGLPNQPSIERLLLAAAIGMPSYAVVFLACSTTERRVAIAVATAFCRGDRAGVKTQLSHYIAREA